MVRTAGRHYAVRRADLAGIRRVDAPLADQADGTGQPWITAELGSLLDPSDTGVCTRPQALLVPLRRRTVALLVERVEEFLEQPSIQPLPALLSSRLCEPWAAGVLLVADELVVILDLRAVARTAFLATHGRARGGQALENVGGPALPEI